MQNKTSRRREVFVLCKILTTQCGKLFTITKKYVEKLINP